MLLLKHLRPSEEFHLYKGELHRVYRREELTYPDECGTVYVVVTDKKSGKLKVVDENAYVFRIDE